MVLEYAEHQALLAQIDDLTSQVEALDRKIENAVKPDVVVSPVDEQALAEALVIKLDSRYARRPGPKPKTPSAA